MTPSRPPRGPIDRNAALLMLGLCLCWALQQIAVKWAAPDMAPVAQIGWRSAVAAGLVALFMAWRREPLHWRRNGRAGAWVGLLFGVEFLLVAEALVRTSAAHTVVFLYTAPLFAALMSATLLGEAPGWHHAAAFALIVGGIWLSTRSAAPTNGR